MCWLARSTRQSTPYNKLYNTCQIRSSAVHTLSVSDSASSGPSVQTLAAFQSHFSRSRGPASVVPDSDSNSRSAYSLVTRRDCLHSLTSNTSQPSHPPPRLSFLPLFRFGLSRSPSIATLTLTRYETPGGAFLGWRASGAFQLPYAIGSPGRRV